MTVSPVGCDCTLAPSFLNVPNLYTSASDTKTNSKGPIENSPESVHTVAQTRRVRHVLRVIETEEKTHTHKDTHTCR